MTVTLATLKDSTPQQVFDQVATHLLTQMERSLIDSDACAYRGEGGTRCAAGCLIADDEYHEDMEDNDWGDLIADHRVTPCHRELITQLQSVHDNHRPADWRLQLARVADRFGLDDRRLFGAKTA